MPKRPTTQGLAILFDAPPGHESIAAGLAELGSPSFNEGAEGSAWMGEFPTHVLPMPSGGHTLIQVVPRPWPDHMGSPGKEAGLFGAWATGFFGPFAFPQALDRATQHSYGWKTAAQAVASHRAFVRVLSTYAVGARPDDPVVPAGYDALAELSFVTEVTHRVATVSGALAWFAPGGEVLLPPAEVATSKTWHSERGLQPLPIWANVRMFRPGSAPGWLLMDSVGMDQLDGIDIEACFPSPRYRAQDVDRFIRNAGEYVRTRGPVVRDGDTMDGPGGLRWRAYTQDALIPRPRTVLRWLPEDSPSVPELFQPREKPEPRKR